jgi:NDP-sugar pyrophosphorylase family protein
VTIAPFGYLGNTVIGSGARIGPSSSIHNSVVGGHSVLGGHFTARSGPAAIRVDDEFHQVTIGAMIGEAAEIEDNVIVQPGVIIGNHTHIRPLKVIVESIPDRSLVV